MIIVLMPWVKLHGILIITIYSSLVLLIYVLIVINNTYIYISKLRKKLKRVKKNNKALKEQMNIYTDKYKIKNVIPISSFEDFKNLKLIRDVFLEVINYTNIRN